MLTMKNRYLAHLLGFVTCLMGGVACGSPPDVNGHTPAKLTAAPAGAKTLIVAGGCFWCIEDVFNELKGVYHADSGYSGGHVKNPTYGDVCTGTTGHAEAVRIVFDPKQISEEDLLRIFFTVHDPTTIDRQGNDAGPQYRSAIFVANPSEKKVAERIIAEVNKAKIWPDPIVTKLEPLGAFYPAEVYHQDYFAKFEKADDSTRGQMNTGYCRFIIAPKVAKFRHKYADRLKKKG